MHTTGTASVALGITVAVRVGGGSTVFVLTRIGVEVGCSSEVTMMTGGNGVGCCGGLVSANESEIPPTTSKREMMAIRTPPPI